MAESYCLKFCAECDQCAGCRAGEYAARCDIAKCCREKNHAACESCTRVSFCSTRTARDLMPRKLHDQDRREAELRAGYRENAGVIAKWTMVIFGCLIAMNAVSLLGLLRNVAPMFHWVDLIGRAGLMLGASYGMMQMQGVDGRFRTVAIWELVTYGAAVLTAELVGEENGPLILLQLVIGAVGIYVMKVKVDAFQNALSGISREMSAKWEKQWDLYKKSLMVLLGGFVSCLILSVWGLVVVIAGIGVMLFVDIREYVYLYQTAKVCRTFHEGENEG